MSLWSLSSLAALAHIAGLDVNFRNQTLLCGIYVAELLYFPNPNHFPGTTLSGTPAAWTAYSRS